MPFVLTQTLTPWLMIGGRVISTIWAYHRVKELNGDRASSNQASDLMDNAARLEKIDKNQAIAAYEQVVDLFPNTTPQLKLREPLKH